VVSKRFRWPVVMSTVTLLFGAMNVVVAEGQTLSCPQFIDHEIASKDVPTGGAQTSWRIGQLIGSHPTVWDITWAPEHRGTRPGMETLLTWSSNGYGTTRRSRSNASEICPRSLLSRSTSNKGMEEDGWSPFRRSRSTRGMEEETHLAEEGTDLAEGGTDLMEAVVVTCSSHQN